MFGINPQLYFFRALFKLYENHVMAQYNFFPKKSKHPFRNTTALKVKVVCQK